MEIFRKINNLSLRYQDYTAQNLSKMVQIKSLSMGEKEVQLELKRQMLEAGFDEVRIDGLGNVIGRIGTGKIILAIDAHMDTVDTGQLQNWDSDPFSGIIKDGFVHGRGTVDQEGGAAAFVTSGKILKELGFDKDLTIYFVGSVMEEDCDGLCWKYLVEEEGIKPHFAISTEPTNLNIYRGHRGRMEIGVHFYGVSCHGSAPERGDNAIYKAAKAALEIEKLNDQITSDDFLGKGTVTISEIKSGSPSLCAVADYAYFHLDRRLTWGETKESAVAQIEEIVKGMNAKVEVLYYEEMAYTGLKYGMEKYYPTWKIEEDHLIVQTGVNVFTQLFDKKPKVDKWTFSTNGVTINGYYKIPLIGFGPGNEVMAHAPNEKVPIDHLIKASAFYAGFAYQLAENMKTTK
ncbi:MAG TPA: YgeY family selenium metabolism-linked hydrolase [Marinilabiliales bacterium]|nr:MAG: selenium metabolism hydrolase [Bacteroidetes bacterium GWA2_40_14]OFX61201.1 MAG: selenium metabolism hydrolase [Bacteroidetes bacterium GWC2_40_13]OFX75265.1 MAG: selenium metabolism hydrolase [Bacteroidetes bacterium GWD2_40_43]OFX89862.1 MAG: selenium metabolism hydrolase [Bacteroidetes bacterium GWE2_40_63]OFY17778.1 MAG: selenium metabolism hydrolase [Bacteroidetes bacterium GWF2_40_13]OFZ30292.1 MAG: selenium metabolism hydrolase [Bacteroidetes bacterium RIFOXYC2_FULL_40_12]HAM9